MTKRTRVAKEQAREFYEKVVKPHQRERYIVETLCPANSPVIFTVWDTKINAPYKYCFATQAEANQVCSYFNNKHREKQP